MPKTTKGRVVYERKPHLFTYRDVLRIVRKVELPDAPGKPVEELGWAIATLEAAFSDVIKGIRALVPDERIFWANRTAMALLASMIDLISFIPQRGGEILQRVVDWFAEQATNE